MRHLLLTLLLLHPLAWGDVIQPDDESIGSGVHADGEKLETGAGLAPNTLFWLSILENQAYRKADTSFEQMDGRPALQNPSPFHWQTPATQQSWTLPEPGTLLLFAAGIFLMYVARRVKLANRRRKNESARPSNFP